MERSVIYNCHGPFHERPDLWWPVYVENVCYLDNDIFEGKTALEVAATPLVSETAWHDLPPVQIASLGSFTTPRADHSPVWQGSQVSTFTASTVTHYTTTISTDAAIFLGSSGLMLITALAALVMMKGLRG